MELKFKLPKLKVVEEAPDETGQADGVAIESTDGPAPDGPTIGVPSEARKPVGWRHQVFRPFTAVLLFAVLAAIPIVHQITAKRPVTCDEILTQLSAHHFVLDTSDIARRFSAATKGQWSQVAQPWSVIRIVDVDYSYIDEAKHKLQSMGPSIRSKLVNYMGNESVGDAQFGVCGEVLATFGQSSVPFLVDQLKLATVREATATTGTKFKSLIILHDLKVIGYPSVQALSDMTQSKNKEDSEFAWQFLPQVMLNPLYNLGSHLDQQAHFRMPAGLESKILERIVEIDRMKELVSKQNGVKLPDNDASFVGAHRGYFHIGPADLDPHRQAIIEKLRNLEFERNGLLETLGYLPSPHPSTLAMLLKELQESKNRIERCAAAFAIGNILMYSGSDFPTPGVAPEPDLFTSSPTNLPETQRHKAMEALKKACEDSDGKLRQIAWQAMCYAAVTNSDCRSAIMTAINQTNAETKFSAIEAALSLGPEKAKLVAEALRQQYENGLKIQSMDPQEASDQASLFEHIATKYPNIGIPPLIDMLADDRVGEPRKINPYPGFAAESLCRIKYMLSPYKQQIKSLTTSKNKYTAMWSRKVLTTMVAFDNEANTAGKTED